MMFHTFNKQKANRIGNKQEGVSLLLAVLILAAVTAVAFSVATIVFIEIRSSGDSLRSEPNLYATLGLTEEALFQYKRGYEPNDPEDPDEYNVLNCDGTPGEDNQNVCSINGVNMALPGSQPLRFDNNPRVEYIERNSTTLVSLYEVNEYVQEYENIRVEVFPNETDAPIGIYFKKIGANGIISYVPPTINPTDPCPGGLLADASEGQPYSYGSFDSDNTEMYLVNCTNDQDIAVSIVTTPNSDIRDDINDPHYGQPEGLPFTGRRVFRIVADNLGLTRTYQVEIPIP